MAVCDTAEKEVSTVSDKEVVLAGSVFQKAHSMSHSGRTPTNQPHILDMVLLLTNGKNVLIGDGLSLSLPHWFVVASKQKIDPGYQLTKRFATNYGWQKEGLNQFMSL